MAEWNIIFPMDYFYTTWWSPLVESCRACGRRWAEVGASDCLIAWCEQDEPCSYFFFFFWAVEQWSNSRRVNRWKPGRAKRPAAAVSEGTSIIRAVLSDIFSLQWCCRCWIADGDNVFPQFMCPPYTVLVSCASWWHGPYNKGYDVCHYFAMHGLRFLSNNWMPAICCEARNTANPRIQGFTLSRATKANQLHQALFS